LKSETLQVLKGYCLCGFSNGHGQGQVQVTGIITKQKVLSHNNGIITFNDESNMRLAPLGNGKISIIVAYVPASIAMKSRLAKLDFRVRVNNEVLFLDQTLESQITVEQWPMNVQKAYHIAV
jgi:hypothetical protein